VLNLQRLRERLRSSCSFSCSFCSGCWSGDPDPRSRRPEAASRIGSGFTATAAALPLLRSGLAALPRAHAGEVTVLGIDVQDFKSDGRRFLGRFDTPYVAVRDGGGSTYAGYGLTGVPETYWLDPRGRTVRRDRNASRSVQGE
jgi:hypothetical protein